MVKDKWKNSDENLKLTANRRWETVYKRLMDGEKVDHQEIAFAMQQTNSADDCWEESYKQYQRKLKEYNDHSKQHLRHQ